MAALAETPCVRAAASRPTLVGSPTPPRASHRGYHRAYVIASASAAGDAARCLPECLLQRVRVRIRYHSGDVLWADYHQTYYEFFRFDAQDGSLVDTHDFDLMRDGWRQAVILGLVKKHRHASHVAPTGEAVLEVCKQFLLAPGSVHDTKPTQLTAAASFGLLSTGPDGPSRTALRIARGDGSHAHVDSLPSCPAGYPIAGCGSFVSDRGWRAFERFTYRFATLTGTLQDRAHYRPARLSPADLCNPTA